MRKKPTTSKRIVFWLGVALLIVAALLGRRGGGLRPIPELTPLPQGWDSDTYHHAQQIVELVRSLTGTQHDLDEVKRQLARERTAITREEE